MIPFFDKYLLLTNKSLDFVDWKRLIEMKNSKLHYTEEGVKKIQHEPPALRVRRTDPPSEGPGSR